MNNRTPLILIVALLSLGLAFFNAQMLRSAKTDINPALGKGLISPVCFGFNKFCSHLRWMWLLQDRGATEKLNEELAGRLYRRSENLTSLDPFFFEAYGQAALEIGYLKQDLAIKLLDKAMKTGKCRDWNIPFRAGWIAAYWKDDPKTAITYYEKAVGLPGAPAHIERLILYQKGKLAKNDPETVLQLWCNYLGLSKTTGPRASKQGTRMDAGDLQLALKKVNDIGDRLIAETKVRYEKTKDPALPKKIAFLQQMITDASQAAQSSQDSGGASNLTMVVGNQKITLMEPKTSRKGFSIQNVGSRPVYLKLGYGASKSSYGYILSPNGGSYSAQGYDDVITAICPDGQSEVAIIEIY